MKHFCKSNVATQKMKGSSCSGNTQKTGSCFCSAGGGCKTQIYLKSLRRTISPKSAFESC